MLGCYAGLWLDLADPLVLVRSYGPHWHVAVVQRYRDLDFDVVFGDVRREDPEAPPKALMLSGRISGPFGALKWLIHWWLYKCAYERSARRWLAALGPSLQFAFSGVPN